MNIEILPIPTRILTEKDDIAEAIYEYAKDKVGKDDLVCTAESVVAITQHQFVRPEELTVSPLAELCCRFIPDYGSLASPHGMQSLMNREGEYRVAFALFCGFLARLIGIRGLFYKWGGEQAALIDDVTGTMPPFDKCIVYGPNNPDAVAENIKEKMGCYAAMIADVNDLKRSRVVGVSKGLNGELAAKLLIDNPFGNASQKTPICVIKNYRKYQEEHK